MARKKKQRVGEEGKERGTEIPVVRPGINGRISFNWRLLEAANSLWPVSFISYLIG